jgi:hypothetical protein
MSHRSLLAPASSRYLWHHHLEKLTTVFYGVHYCICTFMNDWSCTSRLSTMIYKCSLKNSMLIPEKVFFCENITEKVWECTHSELAIFSCCTSNTFHTLILFASTTPNGEGVYCIPCHNLKSDLSLYLVLYHL